MFLQLATTTTKMYTLLLLFCFVFVKLLLLRFFTAVQIRELFTLKKYCLSTEAFAVNHVTFFTHSAKFDFFLSLERNGNFEK